ncbi:AAA family ATPase [Cohaesibacter celericrescens]|uniref:Aminoglycoside phosphotransferase domain-containing protein n=1 Tax=Cohaesibacter celericrescens TaxID=2067669 RepID=A0A2N5XKA0_9HYPH|nr:AAA family ATPase [Cohaesibacter celericrescens]PLW74941.1 hypothetical protein C0081_21785 [Cohaesibacter celericrescens]
MDTLRSQVSTATASAPPDTDGQLQSGQAAEASFSHMSQNAVLAFLADANSYGSKEPVDRIDSAQHILFLSGPFCYKLHRQLPLGQTDPLSLERRYHLAQLEMRLGKMFAPDLYLDLVPVRVDTKGQFLQLPKPASEGSEAGTYSAFSAVCQNTQIVDWLVRLRRYDFSKSYDKQVELYQPNFAECQRLSHLIAKKGTNTNCHTPGQSWQLHLNEMLDGFAAVVRQLDRYAKQTTLRACLNRARDQFERARSVFETRGRRGLIGQIHGNVGLGNVVELPDGLRLVNPQVSCNNVDVREWVGDPLYDLGSLIGEFWSRGLNRQANWVFSNYCNQLLDSHSLDGLEVLDLYLFVRAMEQARMLAADVVHQDSTFGRKDEACGKTAALRGYIKTARESLLQDEAILIVIGGSSHSNRSHLARLLAPETGRMPGALYLSVYQEILALHEVSKEADLTPSANRPSIWRLAYRRIADKARMAIAAGYSVVLEGRFDSPISRQNLTQLAQEEGSTLRVVAFHLYDPLHDNRPVDRSPARSDHLDLELQAELPMDRSKRAIQTHRTIDPILGSQGIDRDWTNWIELDASRSVGDLLGQTLGHINPAWVPNSKETLH